MKTISELNEKWWYRLVKVVYIFTFLFISYIFLVTIFEDTKPYQTIDLGNSKLICEKNGGRVITEISFSEVNKIKNNSNAYAVLEKDWDRDDLIAELCNIYIPTETKKAPFSDREYTLKKDGWRETVLSQHSLEKVNKTVGSYWRTLGFMFIALILTLFAFEVLRRVFYYIVLGSIRPKK